MNFIQCAPRPITKGKEVSRPEFGQPIQRKGIGINYGPIDQSKEERPGIVVPCVGTTTHERSKPMQERHAKSFPKKRLTI